MDALQILIDATEGSLDIAEPLSAAQVLMLARTLVDHSLAGREARPSVRISHDGIEFGYQPDHLITRLEDATARLNELAPGDDGDTPRLEAAIERVADLLDEVRSQRDRESHIRCWVLHGLRRIEDLTVPPLNAVYGIPIIDAQAVHQIIAETREQAYLGSTLPPSAEVERITAERDEVLRKVDEAETLLAEMQGALSKVQRDVMSSQAAHASALKAMERFRAERDQLRVLQAGQAEALQHLSTELRKMRQERDQALADFASFRAFQFGNEDEPAS